MKTKQIVEKCGMLLDLILNPSESDKIQKAANTSFLDSESEARRWPWYNIAGGVTKETDYKLWKLLDVWRFRTVGFSELCCL